MVFISVAANFGGVGIDQSCISLEGFVSVVVLDLIAVACFPGLSDLT